MKKIAETDAIFKSVHHINAEAYSGHDCLCISLDTKATVAIAAFSRGGNNRCGIKALDHDFAPVYVRTWWGGAPANAGVCLLDFEIGLPQPTADQALDWTVRITDADSDSASFSTGIDSNGYIITRPVNI